jgi:hypothetical protein
VTGLSVRIAARQLLTQPPKSPDMFLMTNAAYLVRFWSDFSDSVQKVFNSFLETFFID